MGVKRAGVPVQVLHRYDGGRASMEGRLLGVVPLFRHSGPELTRSETVTLLNDVFFLAPAALVELGVEWEMLDDTSVRASFSRAGHEVSAVAYCDEAGDLVNFESLDRDRMEGGAPRPDRWTTPFYAPQEFGGHRLPSGGRACWGGPGEEWAYADFVLESIRYDPDGPSG